MTENAKQVGHLWYPLLLSLYHITHPQAHPLLSARSMLEGTAIYFGISATPQFWESWTWYCILSPPQFFPSPPLSDDTVFTIIVDVIVASTMAIPFKFGT